MPHVIEELVSLFGFLVLLINTVLVVFPHPGPLSGSDVQSSVVLELLLLR
jgi:hypothetical protein